MEFFQVLTWKVYIILLIGHCFKHSISLLIIRTINCLTDFGVQVNTSARVTWDTFRRPAFPFRSENKVTIRMFSIDCQVTKSGPNSTQFDSTQESQPISGLTSRVESQIGGFSKTECEVPHCEVSRFAGYHIVLRNLKSDPCKSKIEYLKITT